MAVIPYMVNEEPIISVPWSGIALGNFEGVGNDKSSKIDGSVLRFTGCLLIYRVVKT